MPLWRFATLRRAAQTVVIGVIKDKTNVASPQSGLKFEMPSLSENMEDIVHLSQGADPTNLDPADISPIISIHDASRAPSFSRSTPPSAALLPLAHVQKLEA